MKLIFAVLDVSLTMGLTRCYKTEGFLHLYLQFLYTFHAISIRYTRLKRWKSICIPNFDKIPQSMAEIKLLPVSDDGWPPYWNFTSNFHFDLQRMCNYPHVMLHPPAKFRRNRTNIGGLLTSYRFFKMAVMRYLNPLLR